MYKYLWYQSNSQTSDISIWGSHIGVDKDTVLLGCDTISVIQ